MNLESKAIDAALTETKLIFYFIPCEEAFVASVRVDEDSQT